MTLKRNKIIVFAVILAFIMQTVAIPGNTIFASDGAANNDFESVKANAPSGWTATNAVISSDDNFWHSGTHSLKIEKKQC